MSDKQINEALEAIKRLTHAAIRKSCDLHEDKTFQQAHHRDGGIVIAALERQRVPHQCTPLARAYMSEGRDWWVGKLIEPVEQYPQESFCLHMKTPIKDVVFLCNRADFEQLTILSRAVIGALNPDWLDRMVVNTTKRAAAPTPEDDDGR